MQFKPRTFGIAGLCCAVLIFAGAVLSQWLSVAAAIPLLLPLLLYIAWRFPFTVAVASCCVATLTLDFFFIAPRYTLRIASAQDVATICCFLPVALVISRLSGRLAEKTARLTEREAAQHALYQLAQRSLLLDWRGPLAEELCHAVRECFALERVCLWDDRDRRFASTALTDDSEPVRAAFMAGKNFDLARSRQSIRLLCSGVSSVGSLLVEGALPEASIVGSIASLVSLALERARALSSEVQAQLEMSSEQLRSSVLDGLAHSIKTPLTTISVSCAGVMAIGGLNAAQTRLLALTEEQAHLIAGLTDRLLRTARLEAKVTASYRPVDLAALVNAIAEEVGGAECARIHLSGTSEPLVASTDPELLRMAIVQVAENALKYSPPDSPVRIAVYHSSADGVIAIHNEGSYISPQESRRVFGRFYRSPHVEQSAPGTGLGLSIAKRSIEAIGGSIALASDPALGTTFSIEIPLGSKVK